MIEGGLRVRGAFDKKNSPAQPLVSIITVTKNSAETLEDTIRSVLGQTYHNIEYLIIDGASTDRTLEVVAKYDDWIAYWISAQDRNLYEAMNRGIQYSTGDIIGIVNSDDWLETDAVESVVSTMTENAGTDVVHGNLNIRSPDGRLEAVTRPRLYKAAYYVSLPLYHPTCFVTKRTYERFGMFDIRYPIMADYDLFLRLKKHNVLMRYLDKTISNMRSGGRADTPKSLRDAMKESLQVKANNGVNIVLSWLGVAVHVLKFYIYRLFMALNLHGLIRFYRGMKNVR